MTEPRRGPLRTDAQENRARILEVARDALAASADVSLNSIAKQAGVGAGTLYRHFPNRDALVLAVYRNEIERLVEWVPELLAERPPLVALRSWIERLAFYVKIKHGLGDALSGATRENIVGETYGPVVGAIGVLLRACEEGGVVRGGLDADDVLLLVGCLWRVGSGEGAEAQGRRLLDLIMAGLSSGGSVVD